MEETMEENILELSNQYGNDFFTINGVLDKNTKIEYKFPVSGSVRLIRICGNNGFYDRFDKIKIGDKEFTPKDGMLYAKKSYPNSRQALEDIPYVEKYFKADDSKLENDVRQSYYINTHGAQDYPFVSDFKEGDSFIYENHDYKHINFITIFIDKK